MRRMHESEDLSYSDQVDTNINDTDTQSQSSKQTARIVDGKAVIDEGTLARLIDECREEQESR